MKKSYSWLSVLFLLVAASPSSAQVNADYGVFGGVSYYVGDINSSLPFYSPLPAAGIIYRYNLHPRHSFKGSLTYGGIRGDDLDFSNEYQQARGHSFSGSVFEWAVQFEFNFLPYNTGGRWGDYTPYIAAGAGISFVNSTELTYVPVIPLSVGFKYNIRKNMGLELEYGFRKTFYDNFDGLIDNIDPDHRSWAHNNDWYVFSGITFTWKMFNRLTSCPAYGDFEDKRGRR
jgi:hypothetical protein